ncbi:MAG: EamA family transporter RarD [Thermoflexales bacterium]|nr:EamA family transporter RarD [Thermoflexales bacterium]
MNKGLWYGIAAYGCWGLFPIYWKWLHHVPAIEVIAHRIIWSFVALTIVLLVMRQWRAFQAEALKPRLIARYALAAVFVSINWFVYVWAVNQGFVVETSLGYFINPLLSVLMGVIILREKLRPAQWIPIGLAAAGVIYLTILYGSLPWIALTLAFSFGMYGLLKKLAPLNSLNGLTLETGLLFVPMAVYLIFIEINGQAVFLHTDLGSNLLMLGAGPVTVIPLLLFASAVRRIPLSTVGILQYITPTMQFLLGVLVYGEAFSSAQFIGFGLVWLALIVFTIENVWERRRVLAIVEPV